MWIRSSNPDFVLVLFAIGAVFWLYRGELIKWFSMGMTYTFGGVIPIAAAAIAAVISLLLHPAACCVFRKLKPVS
jgi:hypothetical protein